MEGWYVLHGSFKVYGFSLTYNTLDHLFMYSFIFFPMYEAFGYVIIFGVTLVNFSVLLFILLW